MYSKIIKTVLVLTGLVPIAMVYAWVAISEGDYWIAFWLIIGFSVLVSACWAILTHSRGNIEAMPFKYTTVEPADQENISFVLLYLSPLFVNKMSEVNLNVLIPSAIVYAALIATSYTFQYNPLISLMGWHFYKVASTEGVTYILLTTKKINNLDQIAEVGQLTGYMLLDLSV